MSVESNMIDQGPSVLQIEKQALNEIRNTTINPDVSIATCLLNGNICEMFKISPQTFSNNVNLYSNGMSLIEYRAPFQSRVMNIRESYLRTGLNLNNATQAQWKMVVVYCHKTMFRDIEFIGLGAGGKEFVKKENNNLDVILPHLLPLIAERDIGDNDKTTNDDNFHVAKKYGWKKRNASYTDNTAASTIVCSPLDPLYVRDIIILPPGSSKTVYYNHYLREIAGSIFLSAESQFHLPKSESVLRLYTNNNDTIASGGFNVFEVYNITANPYLLASGINLDFFTYYNSGVGEPDPAQTNSITITNNALGTIVGTNFLTDVAAFQAPGADQTILLTSCDWYIPRLRVDDPLHGMLLNRFVTEGKTFTYPVIKRIYQGQTTGQSFNYSQYFNVADLKSIKYIIIGVNRQSGPSFRARNNITKPTFLYNLDDIRTCELSINGYYYSYGTDNRIFNLVETNTTARNPTNNATTISYNTVKKSNVFVNNYKKTYEKYLIEPEFRSTINVIQGRSADARNFLDSCGLVILEWENNNDFKTDKVVLTDQSMNETNIKYIGVTDNHNYNLTVNMSLGVDWPSQLLEGLVGTNADTQVGPTAFLTAGFNWNVDIYIVGYRGLTIKDTLVAFDYETSLTNL